MSTDNKQLTAAQRLLGLEHSIGAMDQALYNQTQQLSLVRDALSLLNEKVNAMVMLLSLGQAVSDSALDQVIEQKRIDEMKKKVDDLLQSGSLVKAEKVSNKSFLVVREINSETGKVVNPRLQFVASILKEESLTKLLEKKVGDSVKFVEDNSSSVEIEEIYDVVLKGQEQEQDQAQEQALKQETQTEQAV